jgi:hypothetical protein
MAKQANEPVCALDASLFFMTAVTCVGTGIAVLTT